MELKADGDADLHEIDRFDRGVGWIAYPGEAMERASHAIAVPNESETDDVWVFDPVDAPGVDDLGGSRDGRGRRGRARPSQARQRSDRDPTRRSRLRRRLDDRCRRGDRRPRRAVRLAAGGLGVRGVSDPRLHDPPWQEVGFFDGETLIVPVARLRLVLPWRS